MPTRVQIAMYDATKTGTARSRPSARATFEIAGTAPGSIIAAIIDTHTATKNANEPSSVATPISIPAIWLTATTHDAAASASVAVRASVVLVLVMAAHRKVGVPP